MHQRLAIVLLLVMCHAVFPLKLVCLAHPTGHSHYDDHEGPTPCELRDDYDGKHTVVWPPMHCERMEVDVETPPFQERFQLQSPETLPVSSLLPMVVTVIKYDAEREVFAPPLPRHNTDPPPLRHTNRGPPSA